MKKVKLICLPFAGGSQYAYSAFHKYLPAHIELCSIDLPGRGTRMKEKPLSNINAIVDDVFPSICKWTTKPYAIFGHSLGSLLAFLLTKRIRAEQFPLPLSLFLSGYEGPSVTGTQPKRYLLPKKEFMTSLQSLGGMDEVFENKMLSDYYEPILRADIRASETYRYQKESPLNIPMYILKGQDEAFSKKEAMAWQKDCSQSIVLKEYEGGHFFIFQHEASIMQWMTQQIAFHLTSSSTQQEVGG